MQQELTARGVLTDAQLPFVGQKTEAIVQPDGKISIGNIGAVYVAGMSAEEVESAIRKKAIETNPQAARAAFGVFVDVSAKNSKRAYIILEGGAGGDNVSEVPATPETTVSSALQKNAWPHPIDFATAKIWIARPGSNGGCETALPVTWNCNAGQPTCETNHAMLPGDRLFVKLQPEPEFPVPPPVAVMEYPAMPQAIRFYAPSPVATADPCTPIAIGTPATPPVMRYSATPAAAPSPFSPQPSVFQASPVFAALPPLPQPPVPTQQKAPAVDADSCDGDCQVEFAIEVIEDLSGSLVEFPKLRNGTLMISDSDTALTAVRIMENHKLVKRLSSPQIKCVVGEQATFCLASSCECQTKSKDAETLLSVQVKARDPVTSADGSYMIVETGVQATCGQQVRQLQLAYCIEDGQTAIFKTRHESRPGASDEERAVYVVVTPKLVK
jgi:hypothetical protein